MQIPSTIRLSFGPSVVPIRAFIRVTLTRHELFAVIKHDQRDAEEAPVRANKSETQTPSEFRPDGMEG
jgi:hypothetical protein